MVKGLQGEAELDAIRSPMDEYYGLQRRLKLLMAGFVLVIFPATCLFYSLGTGASYLLGALTGVLYFHLLGKAVANLGGPPSRSGRLRFLIVVLVFAVSIKLNLLEVVPTFLGFLTFKVAILFDALRTMYRDAVH
ncbi:hypothetical protein [Anthocerotibacter panamensis]|uniref:hypothetical protein n=1 Tax=Anthocerotibacter panamensis TaxID=2857077 RepID=UPI001C40763C|nr:hypothetical protein [Anthocerotibacter panamensis]